jgi:hypothetical protein
MPPWSARKTEISVLQKDVIKEKAHDIGRLVGG